MIHETAVIHPRARLGKGVRVGPYAVIGEDVEIGDDTDIGPHVVVQGPTVIGRRNRIGAGACLGGDPQDVRYRGEPTWLRIGDDNIIREGVTIHRGTPGGRRETVIGNGNFIMTHAHIGHDCIVGNGTVITHGAGLAGFVEVEDGAVIGGLTGLHQFVRIGALAMVGGCSRIVKDVPPFMTVMGNPARVYGLNSVGLRRNGIGPAGRRTVKQAYRLLYRSGLNVSQALERIEAELTGEAAQEDGYDPVVHLVRFVRASRRGIAPGAEAAANGAADGEEWVGLEQ